MDWFPAVQLIGQGVAIVLIGRLVYQLGRIAGVMDGLATRLTSLEGWRDSGLTPKI